MSQPTLPRPEVSLTTSWRFPEPRVATLDNGLEVWAFDMPGQHVIAIDANLSVPLAEEPRQLEGVATLALRTSDEGSSRHPGSELSDALEASGAEYDGTVGMRTTRCTLDVPATRLDAALPLFAEILCEAEHDDADVARHVALRLAQIDQIAAHGPSTLNQAVRQVEWDAEHRGERPPGGLRESVAAIDGEAVRAFRSQWWRPQNCRVVVAGHFTDDPIAAVGAALGGWQASELKVERTPDPQMRTPEGTRVVHLVDRPGAVQVDLRIVGESINRTHPDHPALQVAVNAVGGSFLSRLNRRLREELGYTYGISMHHEPHRTSGRWQVQASVRTEVAAAALAETFAQLDLARAPLSPAETEDARNHLVGLAPLRYETAGAVVSQASRLGSADLDADWLNRYLADVSRVDADQATAAHQRHVAAGHTVLVGDAASLRPSLEAEGFEVRELVVRY